MYELLALIDAFGKTKIGITGAGTLDGNADNLHRWPWKGDSRRNTASGSAAPDQSADGDALVASGENNTPVRQRVYGSGHYLRPNFIQPYDSLPQP